ncbi:MAG: hypothetical protein U1F76_31670 [Candidatus Competibacteraceae bacterium]
MKSSLRLRRANPRNLFFRGAIKLLQAEELPFLVGGAYALHYYTGVSRDTKDLDLFVHPDDFQYVLDALSSAGYQTEITFSHWLGKAFRGKWTIDIIFNSGNGLTEVDDSWFELAPTSEVLGLPVLLTPLEETIWSKAFILERDRCDSADVAHCILTCVERLDWPRLLRRFGEHWRVLLSHLILFGYIYPSDRDRIPAAVLQELLERLAAERESPSLQEKVCQGTLLSHSQYRVDVEQWGYQDARLAPHGRMTMQEVARWMGAFDRK